MTAAARHAAYQHALAVGFDRAFLVSAAIAVLILVVAITTIRVRRADLLPGMKDDLVQSDVHLIDFHECDQSRGGAQGGRVSGPASGR
jgi:hypothetical protein